MASRLLATCGHCQAGRGEHPQPAGQRLDVAPAAALQPREHCCKVLPYCFMPAPGQGDALPDVGLHHAHVPLQLLLRLHM